MRDGGLGDPKHCVDIRFESRVKLFGREIKNRRNRSLPARIVDENVQTAEFAVCIRDQLLAEGLVADISGVCGRESFSRHPDPLNHVQP